MPAISKIRFTNAVYDNGEKRYNDEVFNFDGNNGAIVLENGGGKTTFIQIAIQAILPHTDLGERKIRDTLLLEGNHCHIAIEWIVNESPRRYALTAVTLYLNNGKLDSHKYVYEYGYDDNNSIENIPFTKDASDGNRRSSSREEMGDYYQSMSQGYINAKTFPTIKEYHNYIEENFKIIPKEWRRIGIINGEEGGIHKFFEGCKTTNNLVDKLLIPVVEEAMEGKGTEDFANTFEKQREHFKKHRRLKKTIDESRQIQKEIYKYVNVYAEYHEEEEIFYNKKSYGKGLYQYISKEEEDINGKLEENIKGREQYTYDLKELNRMEKSYEIALLKNKLSSSKIKYQEEMQRFESHKEELDTKEARVQNLKIANLNKNIRKFKDQIVLYERQLENLEKDQDLSIVEKELAANSSKINGYFQDQTSNLKKDIKKLEFNKKKNKVQLEEYKEAREGLKERYKEVSESYIRNDENKKEKEKRMLHTRRKILSNPETEKIEDEFPKWGKEIAYIEEELVESQENIKILNEEKDELSLQLINHREDLNQASRKKETLKEKIKNIEELEDEILRSLKESIPNLYHVSSIYMKEKQIIGTLENKCDSLRREKEDLLIGERISHRFIDDYKDANYFTAEPLLSKWIDEWNEEFSFLESGSKYIERAADNLDKKEGDYYKEYPYWILAVVVADKEEEKLKSKLEKNLDKISYPIIILSQSKAQGVLRNGSKAIEADISLYPSTWETNTVRKKFLERKEEFSKNAEKVTEDRQDKENQLNRYDNLLSRTIDFLNKYPYKEHLRPLKDDLKNLEDEVDHIKKTIDKKEEKIKKNDEILINENREIQELNIGKDILNKNIGKAREYFKEKREIKEIGRKISNLKTQMSKIEKEQSELGKKTHSIEDKINNIEKNLYDLENEMTNLLDDEIYQEVRNTVTAPSDAAIEVLKMERSDIKDILAKRQRNRRDIEENIKRTRESIDENGKNLRNEKSAAKFLVEEIDFPFYGDREIEELIEEIKELMPKVDKISLVKEKAKDELIKDEINHGNKETSFFKEYDNIIEFIDSLEEVKGDIGEKKQELDERYKYLEKREESLDKEYHSIKKALNLLEKKNERYEYLAGKIEASILNKDLLVEIPYKRIEYVNSLIEELENTNSKLGMKLDKVLKEKSGFESFCNNSISDPRLKNMAISGVTYKERFDELTEWKKIMDRNIDNSIKMLEEDLMEHDKQINQFITHLHSYLKKIAEEIRNIPKKTRIKVDDRWKEIYIIDVPTWEDSYGRQELIDYINTLLDQIEDIGYRSEDEKEKEVSVRKFIESKFQGKELLKIVMGNKGIKVKCRKVTNDRKVNSIPESWERSNKWSGGERWSKNMTLFLGILNYLAEKSQGIQSTGNRNRTVILDNPFGEASSDHVLDPVFFIAEKLGFQIVALTAHSEGKYIRDFFPVVYSCRLRPSKNNETQILTTEKEINYAYLKDNNPNTLRRLGDVEQLTII